MSRVFKTRYFNRWMRKTQLDDRALCDAVLEMMQGLIDAELGGGVVKKRVGVAGRGKQGGARTLLADDLLSMSATALDSACQRDELQEICHENKK